jgi:hypothetical protein
VPSIDKNMGHPELSHTAREMLTGTSSLEEFAVPGKLVMCIHMTQCVPMDAHGSIIHGNQH